MWNGTAEILKAKPTNINTIPKVRPNEFEIICSEIIWKLVEPEKPYIKEHPYNKSPEDNALSTKYFTPDSEDNILSLLNDASTYNAKDWSSNPM